MSKLSVVPRLTAEPVARKFERMGARVKFVELPPLRRRSPLRTQLPNGRFFVNILHDQKGDYFEITKSAGAIVTVLHLDPADRHLLLMAPDKSKFLCGHDERHWFAAAIPEKVRGVSTVSTAKEALKPAPVLENQERLGVKHRQRGRRRTAAYVRQGEWFFLRRADIKDSPGNILYNEPIRRGAGKPHLCEQLCRSGGEKVYVSRTHPRGLTEERFKSLAPDKRTSQPWRMMVRNPKVYVRGRITHPDHKTVVLREWHEVMMNTESQAVGMHHLAFLD